MSEEDLPNTNTDAQNSAEQVFVRSQTEAYSCSQKFFWNGITLLVKPAVAPGSQSVITFENHYNATYALSKLESRHSLRYFDACKRIGI